MLPRLACCVDIPWTSPIPNRRCVAALVFRRVGESAPPLSSDGHRWCLLVGATTSQRRGGGGRCSLPGATTSQRRGRTGVLARSRDDEWAAGQTMVLARGRDNGVGSRADDSALALAAIPCLLVQRRVGGGAKRWILTQPPSRWVRRRGGRRGRWSRREGNRGCASTSASHLRRRRQPSSRPSTSRPSSWPSQLSTSAIVDIGHRRGRRRVGHVVGGLWQKGEARI